LQDAPKRTRRNALLASAVVVLGTAIATHFWMRPTALLNAPVDDFVALFAAPPAADSPQTRAEIAELLAIQQARTRAAEDLARRDRKTEIWQFTVQLGLRSEDRRRLALLESLANDVEGNARQYVRAAKLKFRRLRPYEVENGIEPCIDDVRGDLSYPSGHATYGFLMAYLLADMVPERRADLLARAEQFAHQRMVCGVHFASDIEAGKRGADWLAARLRESAPYREKAEPARRQLRAVLGLAETPPAVVNSARSRKSASRQRRNSRRAAHACHCLSAVIHRTCAATRAAHHSA
jgi:acid phosphatase (class A)